MKKLVGLVSVLCMLCVGGHLVFASASQQGCESSGGQAAGCGGSTTNEGGNARANGGDATAIGVGFGEGGNASSHSSSTAVGVNSLDNDLSVDTGVENTLTTGSTAHTGDNTIDGDTTTVEGDKVKVYSYGHAAAPAAERTDSISIGTVLGGIGLSQTSRFAKTEVHLDRLEAACAEGLYGEAGSTEYDENCVVVRKRQIKRLGNMSKTNDRGLFNLFGLF